MPFVDIYSKDDFASIFYITNTEYDCVGGFDPEKPTILMLHPTTLDSSWLTEQFSDPRLGSNFNLIAFDMRVCGQSVCRANGKHDLWVEAADIAMCCQVSSDTLLISFAVKYLLFLRNYTYHPATFLLAKP